MIPCGTDSAYRGHRRRGEPTDEACRRAHAEAKTDRLRNNPEGQRRQVRTARVTRRALKVLAERHLPEFKEILWEEFRKDREQ